MAMGLLSSGSDGGRHHHNGNVRDAANSNGEQHAADKTVQPNMDAVKALRPSGYKGSHRA